MDDSQVSQRCQRSTRYVDTGNSATDHSEENESIDGMCQPHLIPVFESNDKWAAKCALPIHKVRVIIRHYHPHEPDVENEKAKDAPEYRHHNGFDCLSRVYCLAGNDGNMLGWIGLVSMSKFAMIYSWHIPEPKLKAA